MLEKNNIDEVIDIRLNNTSQLAAFAKYPDIEFFLHRISNINYRHDVYFAPKEMTLKRYKKKEISWAQYKVEFAETMQNRNIGFYIKKHYSENKTYCLLCSEAEADFCHRKLVANIFKEVDKDIVIIDL